MLDQCWQVFQRMIVLLSLDNLLQQLLTEDNVTKSFRKKEGEVLEEFFLLTVVQGKDLVVAAFVEEEGEGLWTNPWKDNTKPTMTPNHAEFIAIMIPGPLKKKLYKKHGYPGSRNVGNGREEGRTDDSLLIFEVRS